ncbi:hypothetical protein YC2023_010629 [Brassica napus]
MDCHLCFDPGTTPASLSHDLQEHCEKSDLINSQPNMFVKTSSHDVIRFGLDMMKDFCVSKSFLKHSKGIDHYEKSLELDLNQTDFCYLDFCDFVLQPDLPEIWRNFVVQTDYLGDAIDRVSFQNGYLNIQKVFCHESNFSVKPTHKGFTEAWNHLKIFTEEGVLQPSIRKYQTSKGDSGLRKKRPEPKPILHEPKVFPQSTSCPNQKNFVLNEQDKHDHFPRRANNDERQRTWNYLMKMTSKLQGSFCPIFSFTEFPLNLNSFVSDFFPFDIGTMDLRINPFEEGGNDVLQSTYQYIEPAQNGVQNFLNISTEVQVFHRTRLTDRAVYWTVPHTSGKKLWLEPWPHDRSDRTGACLCRPTSQDKADGQTRINLGRANSDSDHSFSLLARLARTACTDDRAEDLSTLFDPIMDFSFGYLSKARILKLS